jgi:hypothetical protein
MSDTQPYRGPLVLEDENKEVRVEKRYTRKGERLHVRSQTGDSISLDALLLESVSWQGHDGPLAGMIDTDVDAGVDDLTSADRPDPQDDVGAPITVTNEFAEVRIRKVATSLGDRLQIAAPKMDFDVLLHASSLAQLAALDTDETLTQLLETPYGPES